MSGNQAYLIPMICGGLFSLMLGAIGVVLIVLYIRNKQKGEASKSWPSTQGRIISTNIRVDESDDEDLPRVTYIPEVHFEYQFGDTVYQGKRISFGSEPSFGSREKALNFLRQYPVGRVVAVFYNPEKPTEAVLSQGMRKMGASLIVGIIMVVLMVCFLCPIGVGIVNLITAQ